MHLSGENIRVAQTQVKYLQSDITQASIYDSFPQQNAQSPSNISKIKYCATVGKIRNIAALFLLLLFCRSTSRF